ncbi:LacI family transcriptional regulator [Microbacterium sp. dk485]|uniref:LacI family DNA-binding transcriptional regulator n=1 Tax=Microbacterium sp. dk485 TaxID=2560021 RepID=UPI001073F434|nr:LacI family DNA-binding transcriptional regulator [Microbacterium sp. dk485]TFV84640.1 LacI family transcriptional regulator [Microbacterium sp. dk485]
MSARRATIADVARAAGVSPSTASVVFSGRAPVTDPTRQRVMDAAQRLGYTGPDPRAASLRRGSSGIVGVVVGARLGAVFSDPVTRLQMDGLAEGLAGVGAGLLLLQDTGEDAAGPSLLTTPLDAAVLVGCNARMRDSLQVLRARDVPVVVIEGDGGAGVPQIRLDNREAQHRLAEHLAEFGHRDVAILTLPTAAERLPGWLDAAAEAEIQVDVAADRLAGAREVYPDAPAYAAGASLIDEGLAAGRMLLSDPAARPTAVLAQSDLLAAGVVRAAEEAGLRVPQDLSVTGFDGVVVDGLSPYELTTAVQPAAEKGRAAGHAVTAMLAGSPAETLLLTCTFRAGNTTGPAPAR